MMGDETSASSVQDILAAYMPVFLRVNIAGDFIDFQFADLLTFRDAVVVEELAVGEDQRTVLFGGEDALLCVVDGVIQSVDLKKKTMLSVDALTGATQISFSVPAAE